MTTPSKQIPVKRVQINNLSELPNDYGTTPGGTMFSTTPGGTRIVYDRSFLLKCRSSPHANTPPRNLPDIPGVTIPEKQKSRHVSEIKEEQEPRPNGGGRPPFGLSPPSNFEAVYAGGPLQQYRHRNFIQQSSALYEKMCEQVATMHEAFKQVLQTEQSSSVYVEDTARVAAAAAAAAAVHVPPPPPPPPCEYELGNNNSSGDGIWQVENGNYAGQAQRRSQLSIWRETKMHQAVEQYMAAAAFGSRTSPNLAASNHVPSQPQVVPQHNSSMNFPPSYNSVNCGPYSNGVRSMQMFKDRPYFVPSLKLHENAN